MAIQERKGLIKKIEEVLGARVLTVVTGDRHGMETRIAPDILALVSEHLTRIGSNTELALFLYTPGGDSIAGWGLVNLLRQYCDRFKVLIPFRALSCGTLISMGADEILMGKRGLISPVDPSVASPFNPQAPGPQQPGGVNLLPVSVEDMNGFLDLARKEIGLKTDEAMVSVLSILANHVHPLALGAVYRAREQNSSLARRLLLSHSSDKAKADRIVMQLTEELPTHNYLIGRKEAGDIGLDVKEPSTELDQLMWELYKEYEELLKLTSPVSMDLDLGAEQQKRVRYERAAVESLHGDTLTQHIFITDNDLLKVAITPPGAQGTINQTMARTVNQGWIVAEDGEVVL